MILAGCCSLDSVASYLADWLEQPELTVRSRLREWYLPADLKSGRRYGDRRKDLPVHTCFASYGFGFGVAGLSPVWPWPWTPRRWPTASCCWPSVCSTAGVPARWPGRSYQPPPKEAGNRYDSMIFCP